MRFALLLLLGIGDNLPGVALSDHGGAEKVVRHINCSGSGITCTSSSTYGTITVSGGGAASTATALASDPTDCSADQFANAIAANGNLTCSAVNYSQLAGTPPKTSPGGSVPQVQFNIDGGSFGGMSDVTSDDGVHLTLVQETSLPSAPVTALLRPFAYSDNGGPPTELWEVDLATGVSSPVGHRAGPIAWRGATGPNTIRTCQFPEYHGASTMVNWGNTTSLSLTSATAANWDAGTLLGRSKHVSLLSGTTANAASEAYQTRASTWRGDGAGRGGFIFTSRQWFSCGGSASCRVFVGLAGCAGACANLATNVEYSTVNNTAYIGADGPDSNLHACSKDFDAGQANCTDLGGSFPKGGAGYEVWLWAAPGGGTINYYVTRLDSAATSSGPVPGTGPGNGPLLSTQLAWHADLDNTDAGRNVLLDFEGMCAWYGQ